MRDVGNLERLQYWCQLVLPAVYDDSLSYYELLAKVVDKLNSVIDNANVMSDAISDNAAAIKELQELFQKFQESGFDDYYRAQIEQWVKDNMENIIRDSIKMVFFGLTDDGYFCAYIPDSWKEITFDTGAVYGRSDYGRLILKFDAEGEGVIDNTYSYSLAEPTKVEQLIADLEVNGKRTDSCFDTLFTNVNETLSKAGDNV